MCLVSEWFKVEDEHLEHRDGPRPGLAVREGIT